MKFSHYRIGDSCFSLCGIYIDKEERNALYVTSNIKTVTCKKCIRRHHLMKVHFKDDDREYWTICGTLVPKEKLSHSLQDIEVTCKICLKAMKSKIIKELQRDLVSRK